jgi:hypothetical protein
MHALRKEGIMLDMSQQTVERVDETPQQERTFEPEILAFCCEH